MQIKINSKELNQALKKLCWLINKEETAVARTIFFDAGDKITLISESYQNAQRLSIVVDGEVVGRGLARIEALPLYKFCKNIKKNDEVLIKFEAGVENADIQVGGMNIKIPALDLDFKENYPLVQEYFKECEEGILPGFIEALNFVKMAMANKDETRKYLQGLNMNATGDTIEIVATDGHFLLKKEIQSKLMLDCFVDQDDVELITKIFNNNEELLIRFNKSAIQISTEKEFFLIRSQERVDFDCQKIINPLFGADVNNHYHIDGESIAAAINQLSDDSKLKATQLAWDGQGNLKLVSKIGNISLKSDGNELKAAFSGKYLAKILKQFGNCKMSMKDGVNPALIQNQEGICIIMPIRDQF
jgi:DNA polymerase III sliding clamp (beta) subunit (PCNA family)